MPCPDDRRLFDYSDENLSPEGRQYIEQHLKTCRRCRDMHQRMLIVLSLLRAGGLVEPPKYLLTRGLSVMPIRQPAWSRAYFGWRVITHDLRQELYRKATLPRFDGAAFERFIRQSYGDDALSRLETLKDTAALVALLFVKIFEVCYKDRLKLAQDLLKSDYLAVTSRLHKQSGKLAYVASESDLVAVSADFISTVNQLPPIWRRLSCDSNAIFGILEGHDLSRPTKPEGLTHGEEEYRGQMLENLRLMLLAFTMLIPS